MKLDIESSLVASQSTLAVNPAVREALPSTNHRRTTQRVEQTAEQVPTQVLLRRGDDKAFEQAERFSQYTTYDQPGSRNASALNAYQSLEKEQKRAELQQMLGVDTYA